MPATAVLTLADLLRAAFPLHTAKRTAAAGGLSYRTVQDWLQRRCCPSADTLLRLASENEELRAELLRRLGGCGVVHQNVAQGVSVVAGGHAAAVGQEAGQASGQAAPAAEADAAGVAPAYDDVERRREWC